MDLFGTGVSTIYQRQVVEAHGGRWLICFVLDKKSADDPDDVRYALAVPFNDDDSADLPAVASLIKFTPPDVKARAERKARCTAAGHPLREKWTMWGGKMKRSCECFAKEESRDVTEADREPKKNGRAGSPRR